MKNVIGIILELFILNQWPPTAEQLEDENRDPTQPLQQFVQRLLVGVDSYHVIGDKKDRLVRSFADDLMFAISNGSYLTLKHCSLGLGLHRMTGQKQPIVLLSKLGHCT